MLQTEFEFILPCGYIDAGGNLHRHGAMRRATALDEVTILGNPKVRANEAYMAILLLSRVITRLGTLTSLEPAAVEQLFATDFTYLQQLYSQINGASSEIVETACPACGTRFALDLQAHG